MPTLKREFVTGPHNNPCGTPSDSERTSPSLVVGLKGRQAEAWTRLVQLYGPMVYGWCRRRGLQATDIDDVMQEVFRTVLARIGEFRHQRSGGTFRGWLWTITRNKLGDHLRRCATRPVAAGGSEALRQLEQTAPDDLEEADLGPEEVGGLYRRALDLIRGEFEPTSWQAFWLVVCEGRSPADVAEQLGISLNAVYLAKSRVLRRLRETLGDADG